MSNGLRTANVHVQVGAGIDRSGHRYVVQPPASYLARNVEASQGGALTKITGAAAVTLDGVGDATIMGGRKGRDAQELFAFGMAGGSVFGETGSPRSIPFGNMLPCEVIGREAVSPAGAIISANVAHVGGFTAVVASIFRDATLVSGANAKALEAVLVILDSSWRVVWGPYYAAEIGILPRVEPVTVDESPGFIFLGMEDPDASPVPASSGFGPGDRTLNACYVDTATLAAPSFSSIGTAWLWDVAGNNKAIVFDTYAPGDKDMVAIAFYDNATSQLTYGIVDSTLTLTSYSEATTSTGGSVAVWVDEPKGTIICYSAELSQILSSALTLASATATNVTGTQPDPPCFYEGSGLLNLNDRVIGITNPTTIVVGAASGDEMPLTRRPQDLGSVRGAMYFRGHTNESTTFARVQGGAELQTLDEHTGLAATYLLHPVVAPAATRQPLWYHDTFHRQADGTGYVGEIGQSAVSDAGAYLYPIIAVDIVNKAEVAPDTIKWDTEDLAIAGFSSFIDDQTRVVVDEVRFDNPTFSVIDHFGSALIAAGSLRAFDGLCSFEPCPEKTPTASASGSPYLIASTIAGSRLRVAVPGSGTAKMAIRRILAYKDRNGVRYRGPLEGTGDIEATFGGTDTDFPDRIDLGLQPSHYPQHYAGLGWELEIYVSDVYDSVSGTAQNFKWAGTFPVNEDATGFFVDTTNIFGGADGLLLDPATPPYTESELENTRPPALQVLARAGSYLFGVGYEDPYEIWASKPLADGLGPEFNPALTIRAPAESGGVVSLAGTDDRLLLLCRNGAWELFTNQGPDAAGDGSFGEFRALWRGDGCVDHRWTVSCDAGVMFLATSGPKWVRTGSSDVEDAAKRIAGLWDPDEVACSIYHPVERRVYLFHTAAGPDALVYDVAANAWTTTTLRADAAAVLGEKLYRQRGSFIYVADDTVALDAADYYLAKIVSPWLRFDDALSFKRCRRIASLLEFIQGTEGKIQISLEYDYVDGVVDSFEYTATEIAALARGAQLTARPSRQKFSAVRVTVEDATELIGGGQGTQRNNLRWALIGHTFEVLVKQGTIKLEQGAKR